MEMDRRTMLHASAAAMTATMASPARAAQNDQGKPADIAGPPPAVTQLLAQKIAEAKYSDIPPAVRQEAIRSLLNWTGCAIGGSHHETIDIAVAALSPFAGPGQASLLGRTHRLPIFNTGAVKRGAA